MSCGFHFPLPLSFSCIFHFLLFSKAIALAHSFIRFLPFLPLVCVLMDSSGCLCSRKRYVLGLVDPGSMVVSSILIVPSGYNMPIATNEAATHRSHAPSSSPHCRIVRPPQFPQPIRRTSGVCATCLSSFQLFTAYKN
ncbi:hypothetical protein HOY82DRAFT_395255 [Tuber indicum]|nr:hypothetical protein HOY82DRAFT_395255 [Tuber indicum]